MKKLLALTIVAGSAIGMATACGGAAVSQDTNTNNSNTGEAYGIVYGTTGLGTAQVVIKDGKIISAELNETLSGTYAAADISGKGFDWAKAEINKSYSYNILSYTFADGFCYSKTATGNGTTANYKGIEVPTDSTCTEQGGTMIAAGGKLDFAKTGDALVEGKFMDGTSYVVGGRNSGYQYEVRFTKNIDGTDETFTDADTAKLIKNVKNDGVNSKRASKNTAYGYYDPANGRTGWGWVDNMTKIENFFIGKTWDQISNINTFDATNTGATFSYTNNYGKLIKEAAKTAFGK